jgi:hypothetical protein
MVGTDVLLVPLHNSDCAFHHVLGALHNTSQSQRADHICPSRTTDYDSGTETHSLGICHHPFTPQALVLHNSSGRGA